MVIRTIRGAYRVIRTLEGSRKIRAYLCREKEGGEEKYLILEPLEDELSKKLLLYFMELSESRHVEHFRECFVKDRMIWLVFSYFEGCSLKQKLREQISIEERMEMGKEFMERIFAQNLPEYLQYEASMIQNVTVSKKYGVVANYLLFEPEKIDDKLFPVIQRNVAVCFRILFGKELKERLLQVLTCFVENLQNSAFTDEIELYRAYRIMEKGMRDAYERGAWSKKGYGIRLKEWSAKYVKYVILFLYGLVICGLTVVFIYICSAPQPIPRDGKWLLNIGTLRMKGCLPEPFCVKMEAEESETEASTEKLDEVENHTTEQHTEYREKETKDDTQEAEMG